MDNTTSASFKDKAILAAIAIGLAAWFIASAENGDTAINRAILVAAFVPLVFIWKPLHWRFSGWAIFGAYIMIALGVAIIFVSREPGDWVAPFLFGTAVAGFVLYSGRLEPVEQRRVDVAWCVVHGLWDQLEKMGLPSGEIARLKKLSPEERAGLMAAIRKPRAWAGVGRTTQPRFMSGSGHGDMLKFSDDGTIDFYHGDAGEYRL